KGASLKRDGVSALRAEYSRTDEVEMEKLNEAREQQLKTVASLQQGAANVGLSEVEIQQRLQNDYVGVNFEQIMAKPSSQQNLLLRDGDVIYVPRELQTVNVGGEVLSPVTAIYLPNRSFKDY